MIGKSLILLAATSSVFAGDLVHQFHSPSFNGIGYSTHVLTIDQLERQNKQKIEDERQARIDEAERDLKATNTYKFKNNLESRIYAQLSKQIADKLFGESASIADTDWVETTTPFGDTVKWKRENDVIYVNVYDSNGSIAMESAIPVGEFAF